MSEPYKQAERVLWDATKLSNPEEVTRPRLEARLAEFTRQVRGLPLPPGWMLGGPYDDCQQHGSLMAYLGRPHQSDTPAGRKRPPYTCVRCGQPMPGKLTDQELMGYETITPYGCARTSCPPATLRDAVVETTRLQLAVWKVVLPEAVPWNLTAEQYLHNSGVNPYKSDTKRWRISPRSMDEEMYKDYDPNQLLRRLENPGYLLPIAGGISLGDLETRWPGTFHWAVRLWALGIAASGETIQSMIEGADMTEPKPRFTVATQAQADAQTSSGGGPTYYRDLYVALDACEVGHAIVDDCLPAGVSTSNIRHALERKGLRYATHPGGGHFSVQRKLKDEDGIPLPKGTKAVVVRKLAAFTDLK